MDGWMCTHNDRNIEVDRDPTASGRFSINEQQRRDTSEHVYRRMIQIPARLPLSATAAAAPVVVLYRIFLPRDYLHFLWVPNKPWNAVREDVTERVNKQIGENLDRFLQHEGWAGESSTNPLFKVCFGLHINGSEMRVIAGEIKSVKAEQQAEQIKNTSWIFYVVVSFSTFAFNHQLLCWFTCWQMLAKTFLYYYKYILVQFWTSSEI